MWLYFDYVLNWYDHTHTQALFLSLSYTNTRSQTYSPTPPPPPSTRRLRTLHAFSPPGLTVRVGGPPSSVSSCGRRGRSRRTRRPAGRSTTGLRRHFQDGFGGFHPRVSFWKVFVQFFFAVFFGMVGLDENNFLVALMWLWVRDVYLFLIQKVEFKEGFLFWVINPGFLHNPIVFE